MKLKVSECKNGTVACFEGEWGVLEGRVLDTWDVGKILLKPTDRVQVRPPSPALRSQDGRPKGPLALPR